MSQSYTVDYSIDPQNGYTMYSVVVDDMSARLTSRYSGCAGNPDEEEYDACRAAIEDLQCRQTVVFTIGSQIYSFDSRTDKLSISNGPVLDLAIASDRSYVAWILTDLVRQLAGAV